MKEVVTTEYNIEGYPDQRYIEIIQKVKPDQATLVPDPPDVLTSNAGWDTLKNKEFLEEVITEIKRFAGRVSLFIETNDKMIEGAAQAGADRIELYTESYATGYTSDKIRAAAPYIHSSELAHQFDLGVNAGHDLSLENLKYLNDNLPYLDEVSIGHALICDSLYLGLENSIQLYLQKLKS